MNKTIVIIGILLMMATLLAAQTTPLHKNHVSNKPSEQFNPSFRDRPGMMEPLMQCMDELKLTDEQQSKLETLRINFEKTRNTLQAEMENLQIDVETAMKAENYTKAKELNKQLNNKQNQLEDARIDFMANRMKELTKEQKEIIKKNMPNMMGRNRMHFGHSMHGNCGMMMQQRQMQKSGEGCGNCDENGSSAERKHLNPDCKEKQEQKK